MDVDLQADGMPLMPAGGGGGGNSLRPYSQQRPQCSRFLRHDAYSTPAAWRVGHSAAQFDLAATRAHCACLIVVC